MPKSATDIVQEIIFSSVIDSIVAMKGAAKGLPNVLVRDLSAVHPNTTLADLPADVQAAIGASVRDAFARLRKEGYAIGPADTMQRPPMRSGPPRTSPGGPRPRRAGPPPSGGKRPPRKPRQD